jgi:tripartite-type tricarboxylate transporter receptor subunit TctC
MVEAGYPGVEGAAWFAMIAPRNTPAPIISRLNEEANKVLSDPGARDRIVELGGTIDAGTPQYLTEKIKAETPRWTKLIKERAITTQ